MKIKKDDGTVIYKCGCGEEFTNVHKYTGHCAFCKKHVKEEKVKSTKLICDFCGKTFKHSNNCSYHMKRCNENPNRIEVKPLSEEHKKSISKSMKKAHKEGRAYVWTHRKTEPSIPEQWLIKILKNEFNMIEDVDYIREKPFHKYFLDFYFPISNLVIEMDGSQHKLVKEQIETDKEKDKLLEKEGYNEIRLYWPYVCSNAKDYIEKLKIVFKDFNVGKEEVIKYNEKIEKERLIKTLIKLIKKIIKKKTKKKINKSKNYENPYYTENNKFDKLGRPNKNILSEIEWKERLQIIQDSNIDFTKPNWKKQINPNSICLSLKIVLATLKYFNIKYYKLERVISEEENEEYLKSGPHYCKKCGTLIKQKYGSGKYCSQECANGRKHTEEQKQKISKSCKESHKKKKLNKL